MAAPPGPPPSAGSTPPRAAPASPPPEAGPPLLRRPTEGRVLFGVCAAVARYLGLDPIVVRLATVLLVFVGGSGLLAYVIGLVVIPAERPGEPVGAAVDGNGTPVAVIGVVLLAIGTVLLAAQLVPAARGLLAPVVLIVLGVLALVGLRRPPRSAAVGQQR